MRNCTPAADCLHDHLSAARGRALHNGCLRAAVTVPRLPGAPAQRVAHVTPAPGCSERTPEVVRAGGHAQAGARLEHGAVHACCGCGRSGGLTCSNASFWAQSPSSRDCVPQSTRCLSDVFHSYCLDWHTSSGSSSVRAWSLGVDRAACRPTKTPRTSAGYWPMIPSPPPPCRHRTRWTRPWRSRSRSPRSRSSSGSKDSEKQL